MPRTVHHAIDNTRPEFTLCGRVGTRLPPGEQALRVEPDAAGIEYGAASDWEHEGDVRITCPICREEIGLPPLTPPPR